MSSAILSALLALAVVQCLAVLSPGPAFIVISRMALHSGRAAASWGAVAIGLGSIMWAAVALFLVGGVASIWPSAIAVLKFAGALYFAYLGIRLWISAAKPLQSTNSARAQGSSRAAFFIALGIQVTNPKAALFFTSVFATFAPPSPDLLFAIIVALIVFFSEFLWFFGVSWIFSRPKNREIYLGARLIIDRSIGVILMCFSVGILTKELSLNFLASIP